jgi:tetratricopeptide (TPR) repeat protein
VVLIALAAFFAAWWAYQDRPLRQMRAAVRDGKWLDGLRRALDYLAKHPQDAEAWKLAARCYGAMGQFGAVEECLAKAGDLDTADLRLRADALIHLERNTQAVEVLRELLAKGGKDPAVLRGLAILEFRRGFHEEAFGLARQLAEFPEHEPTAWYLQATLHNMTRHHQDAVSCLKKALELNPEADRCGVPPDSVLWYLGATLLDTGKSDEAREYFRRALQHAESADSYFSLGEAEEGSGNLAAAEQAWRRALQIDPKFAESMFALAKLALKQNRPEEAIDWLQLAERAGKQGVAIENALSRAYARLDRPDLAQEHARRAEALMAEADAKHEEDSLLTNYPRNIHARMLMTRRAIDSGNIAEAAALVEESLREHPDNPQLLRLRQILSETK